MRMLQRTAVEEQPVVRPTKETNSLIHDAAIHANKFVFDALTQRDQFLPVYFQTTSR